MPRSRTLMDPSEMVRSLRRGDKVCIESPHGSLLVGRVVIASGTHAALNLGGPHGTPGVATPSNIVWVGSPRSRVSIDYTPRASHFAPPPTPRLPAL